MLSYFDPLRACFDEVSNNVGDVRPDSKISPDFIFIYAFDFPVTSQYII